MVCFATQVAVTYHVRETAAVYAAAPESDASPDTDRLGALEEEIVFLAAHIHAAEHRFLTLVAEFERLRGWELGGAPVLRPLVGLPYRFRPRSVPREGACGPGPGEATGNQCLHEPGRALFLEGAGPLPGGDFRERG